MPACANPLFLKWVKEFHAEKNYKKRGGPPRATGYENAIRGIQACTTKFEHPSELKGVPGVGPTCIERLIEKLEGHCARNGIDMPQPKGRAKKQARPKETSESLGLVQRLRNLERETRSQDDEDENSEDEGRPSVCANPLFLQWVQEFHDKKDYRKRGGPPRATGYENALRSIEACTTKYEHPMELAVLTGVGPTCIDRLTEKLEAYCELEGIEMPEYRPKTKQRALSKKKEPTQTLKTGAEAIPVKKRTTAKKRKSNANESDEDYQPLQKRRTGRNSQTRE
ncbi:hypothetical protein EV421DRAFT_1900548 [Armillaria borealis]|uniref:Crossover junction endonuclease MUS81 n=1 Tax=Armillaria borealis TaxID=47425 RepID=A0AA39JW17_9AGAR|nr:hypothetical protein EV421DRAFT_1900548 [Armillaria borealis]